MPGPYLDDETVARIRKIRSGVPNDLLRDDRGHFRKPSTPYRVKVKRMGSNNGKRCFHFGLPAEIVASMDAQLKTRSTSYKKIAQQVGFSHAAVGRHALRCLRPQIVQAYGDKRRSIRDATPIVVWPGPKYYLGERELTAAQVNALPDDDFVLIVIRYAPVRSAEQIAQDTAPNYPLHKMLTREEARALQLEIANRNRVPPEAEPSDI